MLDKTANKRLIRRKTGLRQRRAASRELANQLIAKIIISGVPLQGVLGITGNPDNEIRGVSVFLAKREHDAAMQQKLHHAGRAIPQLLVAISDVALTVDHSQHQVMIVGANITFEQRDLRIQLEHGFLLCEVTVLQYTLGHGLLGIQVRFKVLLVFSAKIEVTTQLGEDFDFQ